MVANVPKRIDSKNVPDPTVWQQEYGSRLFGFARTRLTDRQLAENAVQETYMSALAHSNQFRGESEFITWMFSILKRKIVDAQRSDARYRKAMRKIEESQKASSCEQRTQVDVMVQQETHQLLWEAIEELPERYANALRLYYFEDLSCEQVAGRLDISLANVWITLHRAKARMLKLLPQA